jgi:hypothetical protein
MPLSRLRARRLLAGALGVLVLGGLVGSPTVQGTAAAESGPVSNLIVGATAELTQHVGTWTSTSNGALATRVWLGGLGSLAATSKLVGPVRVQTGIGRHGTVPVTPSGVYTGTFAVRASSVSAQSSGYLAWYDATGAEIGTDRVAGSRTTDASNYWTWITVSGLAPERAAYVSLGAVFESTVAKETHYLALPRLVVAEGGSSDLAGPLRTSGNKIYDAHGEQVVLRGVNRSGAFNTTNPDKRSRHDIDRIKAWGGNAVRITLAQYVWLPGCKAYDPAMPGIVDEVVSWINDAGMLAILDLQWSAPTCDTNGLNPMPDPKSTLFWEQVATRYANEPLVAFDLFNEPHSVSDQVWAEGGTATTASGVTYDAVGMKDLYRTVRGTGAQNLVFIGGLNYASTWPSTAPLADTTNVVYAVHAYNCDAPAKCTYGTGASWLLERFVEAGKTSPIMVTEFGWPDAASRNAHVYNNNVISFAEKQGWGWMPWTWPVNGDCHTNVWFDLIANGSCDVGDTYQPSPAGMPILQGLTRNR